MTIKELIAELDNYNENTEVKIYNDEGTIYQIGNINLNKLWAKMEYCLMIQLVK